jgi:DNA polymerase elongation subunit (family B)
MTNNSILTADFETKTGYYLKKKVQKPFLIGLYNGKKVFILDKGKDSETVLIKNFMKKIDEITLGEKRVYLYFHNLSSFDGVFLLRELVKLHIDFKPLIRHQKVYQICVNLGDKIIFIRDSYLHLSYSLRKAGTIFETKSRKLSFDFNSSLTKDKKEFYQYLKNDVISLFEIIIKYDSLLNFLFESSIIDSITLPSLAHRIFFKYYYAFKFSYLSENIEYNIRSSYLGGINDVYIPYGENLVFLDVNSLYPYVMANNKFGIGNPRSKYLNSSDLHSFCREHQGFVLSKVLCKNMYQPLIALKKDGINIQPVGKFTAFISTPEILYCLENYTDKYI